MSDYEKEQEEWLLMTKNGWNRQQAKEYLKRQEAQRIQEAENERKREEKKEKEEEEEEETIESEETEPQESYEDLVREQEEQEIRQKKLDVLDAMLSKLDREEAEEKDDNELRAKQLELLEKQLNLSAFWNSVLATKWEPLLRDIIFNVQAQMRGSIARLTFTFENDGKTMHTSKRFYGKNGKEVLHELTHEIYGEDEND